jgi:hypothetical protein
MLPLRSLTPLAESAARAAKGGRRRGAAEDRVAARTAGRRAAPGTRGRGAPGGRGPAHVEDGRREWWELNEQGTIIRGERTGATLRLGDPIEVRVARVEAIRGRVDLTPAG